VKRDPIDIAEQFGIHRIALPTPFPVGPVNVYLFRGDTIVLVDTGLNTDENYAQLTRGLSELGLTVSDIDRILITHGHRDHNGMLGRLLTESGAEAYGHPEVAEQGHARPENGEARKAFFVGILSEFGVPEEIRARANSLYDRFRAYAQPYPLRHVLSDEGEALGHRVVFAPGHSASDTLFINETEGYTFVGDHVLEVTNPNPLLRRPRDGEERPRSLVEFQASLRRSREMDLGICLPGHGDPFTGHRKVIDAILTKHERRTQQIETLMREGLTTPFAASKRLFPDLPTENLHLGLSIAVGHMEVLESEGRAVRSMENGVLHFRVA
jgi:glyoxylase-like metal-dependent hydrolase (beta-lactamase superfamily II)